MQVQLMRDGVLNLEAAAELVKGGIRLPLPLADEYKAAAEAERAVEAERDKLRERLRAQLR